MSALVINKLIDFWVVDPSSRIFNNVEARNEGIFAFEAYQQGVYQFVFSNAKYWESKDLTFAIRLGNSTDENASKEHLDPFEHSLSTALHDIKNLYSGKLG